jgi:hypothetical protein
MDGAERRGKGSLLRALDERLLTHDASREVLVSDLARQQQQYQDAEAEGGSQTTPRPVTRCSHPNAYPDTTLRNTTHVAKGVVMAQMRQIFLLAD